MHILASDDFFTFQQRNDAIYQIARGIYLF